MAASATSAHVRRIAVIRPNHRLGNTLLLTPLILELEACFPDAQIELIVTGDAARAIFRRYERVTMVHAFPAKSYRHPGRVLALFVTLRRRYYDLAIDPIPHQRAGRFLLGFLRAHHRVGFFWGIRSRDRMLTHGTDPAVAPLHFAQAPLYLLRSAYVRETVAQAEDHLSPLDLRLTAAERTAGELRLAAVLGPASAQAGARVGIFAHASGAKDYPVTWWHQLIACLRRQEPAMRLLEIVPHDGRPRLADQMPSLHTPDQRLLGATLAALSLFVIADGGVMHLAEAAGARVLGLFKSTDPARYGPYRRMSEALWTQDISATAVAMRICAMLRETKS